MTDNKNGQPEMEKDDYADHLTRVIADADNSKALLQANYKALHNQPAPEVLGGAKHETGAGD